MAAFRRKWIAKWKRRCQAGKLQGQKLGTGENPLLVSVRSGAKFSMPGMMDTILNLGLNDQSVESLAKRSNNPRFAYDSYRRLIQMFGNVVLEIEKSAFEEVFDGKKKQKKAKLDTDLDAKALKEVIAEYKKVVKKHTKPDFPQDPHEQLVMARDAVFRSWQNDRAKHYRRINNIDDMLGTAVNVQAMVYGNLGDTSGTGVGFTRNPAIGDERVLRRVPDECAGRGRGFGRAHAVHILELEKIMPEVYNQLRDITTRLEKHYRDMQDFEFTIQDGKLYMLQTRNGKRTGLAAVRVALQMVDEGLITKEEAIFRVEPNQLYDFLVPRLDEKGDKDRSARQRTSGIARRGCGTDRFHSRRSGREGWPRAKKPGDSGARRNHARRHSRHGSGGGHSDFARRHDQPRGGRYSWHGQVLRCRRGRHRSRRKSTRDASQGPDLQSRRLDFARRHNRPRDQRQAEHACRRRPTIRNC